MSNNKRDLEKERRLLEGLAKLNLLDGLYVYDDATSTTKTKKSSSMYDATGRTRTRNIPAPPAPQKSTMTTMKKPSTSTTTNKLPSTTTTSYEDKIAKKIASNAVDAKNSNNVGAQFQKTSNMPSLEARKVAASSSKAKAKAKVDQPKSVDPKISSITETKTKTTVVQLPNDQSR
uniref:Uncharacterized protein n=1 Tax=Leptocylindrus danicus TaxID=163516 RepID=A0A6U2MF69_9STRA|mmetsp:Transcript_17110/g.25453  ORF Transcript_17110/g.25453 Transcript_17110/m.25453 type:complete len:175 (+) Transcript_17110:60-584(+)